MTNWKLKDYYKVCSNILYAYIPYIPNYRTIINNSVNGRIKYILCGNEYKFTFIELSKHLIDSKINIEKKERKIIWVICHEFAHMHFVKHDENHKKLNALFYKIVCSDLYNSGEYFLANLQIEQLIGTVEHHL